jgi:hypothetical protein
MINKGSIRRKSSEVFRRVIELRKKEYSYTEIRKETGIAKSTINNWLTLAGLTLTKEHLQIQAKKRVENHIIATEASKITRARRKDEEIQSFIMKNKIHFEDPLFNYGIALYEAEGSKETGCKFSNSDYRLIKVFVRFVEKYFSLSKDRNMSFSVYIHETRKSDLAKILNFWAQKIGIEKSRIHVYWKRNRIVSRRENPDYVGQFLVRVIGERVLGSKILAISDIILCKLLKS